MSRQKLQLACIGITCLLIIAGVDLAKTYMKLNHGC